MNQKERLTASIHREIEQSECYGWIPSPAEDDREVRCITFRDYMDRCLYDETDGYYKSGHVRVGKDGDFYTSSQVGSLMGEKLASCIDQLINVDEEERLTIVEWGAGTGALSRQMLTAWLDASRPWLSRLQYIVVDSNPVHLNEARSCLEPVQERMGEGGFIAFMTPDEARSVLQGRRERAVHQERDVQQQTIIVANELLDAFPVHRVQQKNGQLWELGVTTTDSTELATSTANATASAAAEKGELFKYVCMPLSDERILSVLERDGIRLMEGQIAEVNLAAEDWIAELGEMISRGALLLVDYGHEAAELTAPHRMHGTLLCYKDHVAYDRPFLAPGEQDITAHVNFTACKAAAGAAGWNVHYYDTQKQFLIDHGLLQDLVAHDGMNPFSEAARRNRAIRQLLLSDGMSEAFKVLVLHK
ncbi:SAM-dependent MidA family methyltransferase [Paenibacillus taihuensis]|uniref:SAM-dependent MidA family methyltransferase n=1 Tax=Paenibacillus taihuensis TaxID=1156355 RepID=A0A3D9SM73_9BACL|nr:SAM-dependent methyltransferase [Paenibacillus taihuensis]REE93005.1 SAM-dependent MidA family methyltransferase [Paenibacillus taihuensis]